MSGEKKEKIIAAFKVSAEMHEAIARLAASSHRKLMDQVRYLIDRGLQAEEGMGVDERLTKIEGKLGLTKNRGKPSQRIG